MSDENLAVIMSIALGLCALFGIGILVNWNHANYRAHELEMAKIKCTTQQEK